MKATIKDNELTIVLPIVEGVLSSTEVSYVLASTGGFAKNAVKFKDEWLDVSVLAIHPNRAHVKAE